MTEDYEGSEEDIGHAVTPQPESSPKSPDEGNNNAKNHESLGTISNVKDKPILRRLSSLNLNDSSNILLECETRGCSNNNEKLLKHIENADRVLNKPSTSSTNNKYKTNQDITKYDKEYSSKNIMVLGSDKWCTTKERFLETDGNYSIAKTHLEKEIDNGKNLLTNQDDLMKKCDKSITKDLQVPKLNVGAVLIKECFIEPPRISRISKSFHGKTSNSNLNISSVPRRASDSVPSLCRNKHDDVSESIKNTFPTSKAPKSPRRSSEASVQKPVNVDRQFVTQLSQPCPSNVSATSVRKTSLNVESIPVGKSRFTTTLVDEAEHAASVQRENKLMEETTTHSVKNSPRSSLEEN